MTIKYRRANIFHIEAEALVNPVNCQGVMGRGLAAQFKRQYPAMFRDYARACGQGQLTTGQVHTFPVPGTGYPRYIINLPTKDHWRDPSRLAYIETGLQALQLELTRLTIRTVAIPPLGCGLGGLDWKHVQPLIHGAMEPLNDLTAIILVP